MSDPYVNDEFQDFLKLLDEYGWDKKVKFEMAEEPPVPYVTVSATPKVFRHEPDPDVEVSVCWHTYGTEDGSYRLFDASIYNLRDEEAYKLVGIHAVRTFVREFNNG